MNRKPDGNAMNRILAWLCAAAALLLAACGGGSDEAPVLPPQPVLETAAATAADIGPAGGVLEATAADGISYRLEVPAGALPGTVRITMTPVTRIDSLPLSGGMAGAVNLQPSGLQLARSALLHIAAAAPPRAGLTLTGLSIEDGGAQVARELAVVKPTELLVVVNHFSAWGAGYGTTQDLASLALPFGRTAAEQAAVEATVEILFAPLANAADVLRSAYLQLFDGAVMPMLQRAQSDIEVLGAAREYEFWKAGGLISSVLSEAEAGAMGAALQPIQETQIALRITAWNFQAGIKFQQAIGGNNALCAEQKSLAALRNVLFLQQRVSALVPEQVLLDAGIDRLAVLSDLCAKLVVTARNLVQPLQIDQPHDLDMSFGLKFGTDPAVQAVPVQVSFQGDGVRFGKASPANTNALGEFTVAVTAGVSNAPVSMLIFGCLVLEGADVTDVCAVEFVDRSSLDIQGQYKGTFRSTITTASGQIVPVNVPINVTINQTQNGPQGTWEVMLFNGPRGSLSAILSGLELLNFNLNQFAPCQGLFTGNANIDTATRRIVANYTGSDCLGTHANGVTDIVPGRIDGVDYNGTWGRFADGVLMHVFKVRQSGTQIDVSHMMRLGDNPANPLLCRAFYRATDVRGDGGFSAGFRAPGSGADPAPSEAASLNWSVNLARVRGAIVDVFVETAVPPLGQTGGAMIPLAAPPGGCNP